MAVHPIEECLMLAAERCGDLTPFVYERLFAREPAMKALFWRDATGTIKGEMLARVFEVVLDLIAENRYGANMIRAEVVTHSQYDVPPEVFATFFGVVVDTLRERLGEAWTEAFEAAWTALLRDLECLAREAG